MREDLKYGSIGEFVVWDFFSKDKNTKQLVDVRDDLRFRDYDVDFLIEDTDRQFRWAEVKTDSMAHRTGNLAYEFYSSKTYKTQGCFEKTKADVILYYLPGSEQLVEINVGLLRDYVHSLDEETMVCMGDDAQGYLVNLNELYKRQIVEKIHTLKGD